MKILFEMEFYFHKRILVSIKEFISYASQIDVFPFRM